MIGWLCGSVVDSLAPNKLVINANQVGYEVETSVATFMQCSQQQQAVVLYIHTVVREDAFLLYGFLTKEERGLFRLLIKISGVGPKVAMAILSSLTPEQFVDIIHQQQPGLLAKVPGIGKKTAERLMIELKEQVAHMVLPVSSMTSLPKVYAEQEAISALESLGFKSLEASRAVKKINDGEKSAQQLIKLALQLLT